MRTDAGASPAAGSSPDQEPAEGERRSVTVAIITLNRPACVRRCLEHLAAQTRMPEQVLVVDASPGPETREVVTEFPAVEYVRNEHGFGRMTQSRNLALGHAAGDVIAFIDDDAYAAPHWLTHLLEHYDDPRVGAVGGRVLSPDPEAKPEPVSKLGLFTRSGMIAGCFSADPGRPVDVQHIMGCNMSFRRSVLAELGGFRDDLARGIGGICEDTDMSLRVGALGYRIVFDPRASVVHEGAAQASGRRYDVRYEYYARQNHAVMLLRHRGPSVMLLRFLARSTYLDTRALLRAAKHTPTRLPEAVGIYLATYAGRASGLLRGLASWWRHGTDPRRRDPAIEPVRRWLSTRRVGELARAGEGEVAR